MKMEYTISKSQKHQPADLQCTRPRDTAGDSPPVRKHYRIPPHTNSQLRKTHKETVTWLGRSQKQPNRHRTQSIPSPVHQGQTHNPPNKPAERRAPSITLRLKILPPPAHTTHNYTTPTSPPSAPTTVTSHHTMSGSASAAHNLSDSKRSKRGPSSPKTNTPIASTSRHRHALAAGSPSLSAAATLPLDQVLEVTPCKLDTSHMHPTPHACNHLHPVQLRWDPPRAPDSLQKETNLNNTTTGVHQLPINRIMHPPTTTNTHSVKETDSLQPIYKPCTYGSPVSQPITSQCPFHQQPFESLDATQNSHKQPPHKTFSTQQFNTTEASCTPTAVPNPHTTLNNSSKRNHRCPVTQTTPRTEETKYTTSYVNQSLNHTPPHTCQPILPGYTNYAAMYTTPHPSNHSTHPCRIQYTDVALSCNHQKTVQHLDLWPTYTFSKGGTYFGPLHSAARPLAYPQLNGLSTPEQPTVEITTESKVQAPKQLAKLLNEILRVITLPSETSAPLQWDSDILTLTTPDEGSQSLSPPPQLWRGLLLKFSPTDAPKARLAGLLAQQDTQGDRLAIPQAPFVQHPITADIQPATQIDDCLPRARQMVHRFFDPHTASPALLKWTLDNIEDWGLTTVERIACAVYVTIHEVDANQHTRCLLTGQDSAGAAAAVAAVTALLDHTLQQLQGTPHAAREPLEDFLQSFRICNTYKRSKNSAVAICTAVDAESYYDMLTEQSLPVPTPWGDTQLRINFYSNLSDIPDESQDPPEPAAAKALYGSAFWKVGHTVLIKANHPAPPATLFNLALLGLHSLCARGCVPMELQVPKESLLNHPSAQTVLQACEQAQPRSDPPEGWLSPDFPEHFDLPVRGKTVKYGAKHPLYFCPVPTPTGIRPYYCKDIAADLTSTIVVSLYHRADFWRTILGHPRGLVMLHTKVTYAAYLAVRKDQGMPSSGLPKTKGALMSAQIHFGVQRNNFLGPLVKNEKPKWLKKKTTGQPHAPQEDPAPTAGIKRVPLPGPTAGAQPRLALLQAYLTAVSRGTFQEWTPQDSADVEGTPNQRTLPQSPTPGTDLAKQLQSLSVSILRPPMDSSAKNAKRQKKFLDRMAEASQAQHLPDSQDGPHPAPHNPQLQAPEEDSNMTDAGPSLEASTQPPPPNYPPPWPDTINLSPCSQHNPPPCAVNRLMNPGGRPPPTPPRTRTPPPRAPKHAKTSAPQERDNPTRTPRSVKTYQLCTCLPPPVPTPPLKVLNPQETPHPLQGTGAAFKLNTLPSPQALPIPQACTLRSIQLPQHPISTLPHENPLVLQPKQHLTTSHNNG